MKILKVLVAIGLGFLPAAAFADPPLQVGRLNFLSGAVSFAPAEANNDWAAATLNRPVTTGDRLWADRDGRAEMHVGSTAVRMSALTSLDVLNLDGQRLQLRLAQGSVNVRVRRLPGNQTFEIDTPGGAVILGRTGSYRVDVDPSTGATAVAVHHGEAEVLGSAQSFRIADGQQALIPGTGGADHDIVAAPPADDFDAWAASRDRREDRVAATRYVSDQMTGYEDLDEYGSWRVVSNYGPVWVPAVGADWAPYRYGHWVWISPWGWTWVEDEPWGFAPFHYGRWVWLGNYWAWTPGRAVAQPVYAPALVAFIGGADWSVSVGFGGTPAVGWVPLGWHEPYIPWYRVSPTYIRHVNIAYVRSVSVTNIYNLSVNRRAVTHIHYANRSVPSAMTVVSRDTFVSARPISRAVLKVTPRTIRAAPVVGGAPVANPEKASLTPSRSGHRPPTQVARREVIAAHAPPGHASAPGHEHDREASTVSARQVQPHVRVITPRNRNAHPGPASRASPPSSQLRERDARPEHSTKQVQPQARAVHPQERREPQAPAVRGRPPRERETQDKARASMVQPSVQSRPQPQVQRDMQRDQAHANSRPRTQPQTQPDRRRSPRDRDSLPRNLPPPSAGGPQSRRQDRHQASRREDMPPPIERRLPPQHHAPAPAASPAPPRPTPHAAQRQNHPPQAARHENPRQSATRERHRRRERD